MNFIAAAFDAILAAAFARANPRGFAARRLDANHREVLDLFGYSDLPDSAQGYGAGGDVGVSSAGIGAIAATEDGVGYFGAQHTARSETVALLPPSASPDRALAHFTATLTHTPIVPGSLVLKRGTNILAQDKIETTPSSQPGTMAGLVSGTVTTGTLILPGTGTPTSGVGSVNYGSGALAVTPSSRVGNPSGAEAPITATYRTSDDPVARPVPAVVWVDTLELWIAADAADTVTVELSQGTWVAPSGEERESPLMTPVTVDVVNGTVHVLLDIRRWSVAPAADDRNTRKLTVTAGATANITKVDARLTWSLRQG